MHPSPIADTSRPPAPNVRTRIGGYCSQAPHDYPQAACTSTTVPRMSAPGSSRSASAQELGKLLRARRASLTPAELGLPEGRRRRTPGLRREEVSQLAAISPTYYALLEQGRGAHPSPQVLDALATALRLNPAERVSSTHSPTDKTLPGPSLALRKPSYPALPLWSNGSTRTQPTSPADAGTSSPPAPKPAPGGNDTTSHPSAQAPNASATRNSASCYSSTSSSKSPTTPNTSSSPSPPAQTTKSASTRSSHAPHHRSPTIRRTRLRPTDLPTGRRASVRLLASCASRPRTREDDHQ